MEAGGSSREADDSSPSCTITTRKQAVMIRARLGHPPGRGGRYRPGVCPWSREGRSMGALLIQSSMHIGIVHSPANRSGFVVLFKAPECTSPNLPSVIALAAVYQ